MLLSFLSYNTYTQTEDSLYYINIGRMVANKLFEKKIVMFGDYGHNQPAPYSDINSILNNWLSISTNDNKSVNLTYIIEYDNETITGLNQYIASGNINPLLNCVLPDSYLEFLEYSTKLREFSIRIDSINHFRKNKLSFNIKGFEEVGKNNYDKVAKLTEKEWVLWFIKERDSITSTGIIDYMQTNPEEQILIFYGGAHLIKRLWDKSVYWGYGNNFNFSTYEKHGYFLAHYLVNKFGDDNISMFDFWQNPDIKNLLKDSQLQNYSSKLENNNFITKAINLNLPDSLSYDDYIYIVMNNNYLPLIESNRICSNLILEKTIKQINKAKVWFPGYVAANSYFEGLDNIFNLTGLLFQNDTLLNEWYNKNTFDEMDWLYSNKFHDTLLAIIKYKAPKGAYFEVFKYSFNQWFEYYGIYCKLSDTLKDYFENDDWRNNYLNNLFNQLRFTNSIGIYWLGYPDEKIKAKEYLIQFSGEDFQEPEKYLQWYRKKYFGYDY